MKKTLSQNIWLNRQRKDKYFHLAKRKGYRSRAAFKLIEIENKYKIVRKNHNIVDLGAAPGSWCQVMLKVIKNEKNRVLAIDLNDMKPLTNIFFLKQDIKNIIKEQEFLLPLSNIGLVLSDMAPTSTGHKPTDQMRADELCLATLNFSDRYLESGGNCVLKILRGKGEQEIKLFAKKMFKKVEFFKPNSSRKESKEIYLICLSFNNLHK